MSSILLIDDDEDMLAITSRWMTKAGYEVITATSGKAAMEVLSGQKPDLILLDYAMPEMNGPAVLREIRENKALDAVPVLYRTGMEDGNLNTENDGIRPDGVVPKSEGKPCLLRAVEEALAGIRH